MQKMTNMTTLGKVSARVDEFSKNCIDHLVPVKDISFDGLETFRIANNESHPMRPIAQQSIATRLGIPIHYLRKCPPEVQAYNMNHWIKQEKNEQLFVRFDGEEVRAIFTPRYQPIDNFEVLERLDSLGYPPKTPVQCHLDSEFMSLSILDGKQTFSINGDKITPGISVSNSEVGLACLSIAAFLLRLICTNGLIAKTEVHASYKHVSLKVFKEFPQVLEKVSLELTKKREQLRISTESVVDNPATTMENFNRQFQLNKAEKDAVEWGWSREQGYTMFHLVNAYTRASQFEGLSAESSYRLQRTGGMILEMVK
jgi:hypothetical protein